MLLLKFEERLLFFLVPLWVGWDDVPRRRALVFDGESFAIVRLLLGGLSRFIIDTLPSVDGVCWDVLPQHINHFIILISIYLYMYYYKGLSEVYIRDDIYI